MIYELVIIISVLAAVALCASIIVIAIREYRKVADNWQLLWALTAAMLAIFCGILTAIIFGLLQPSYAYWKVTDNTIIAMYISSLLSIPAGMGWGWSFSFVTCRSSIKRGDRPHDFRVQGLLLGWLMGNLGIVACVIERLVKYGYDPYRIGLVGFVGVTAFIGLSILFSSVLYSTCQNWSTNLTLRLVGIALNAATLISGGCLIGGEGVASLLQSSYTRINEWNILIVFYPLWLLFLFGSGGFMLISGAKRSIMLISRL